MRMKVCGQLRKLRRMKRAVIKRERIHIPIYNCILHVYWGSKENDEWREWLKENDEEKLFEEMLTSSSCAFAVEEENGYREFHMFLRELTPGRVAHEVKHVVNFIFAYVGYELAVDNDEVECYLLEWLVDEVYKLI